MRAIIQGKGKPLTLTPTINTRKSRKLKIGIVATEPSGDSLGAELMSALTRQFETPVEFYGVGGDAMAVQGLDSLFSLEKLAVIGPAAFLAAIPRGYVLAKKLVKHLVSNEIQVLIIIDSPEFTHPVARWLRKKNKQLPIFDLVAPSVWAWRPWRARKMKKYIDEVLAVLPFEPRVFTELDGPKCTFVGHPAIDRAKQNTMSGAEFREKFVILPEQPVLVVLPGSRRGEIARHMPIFAETLKNFMTSVGEVRIVLPVIPHMKQEIINQLQHLDLNLLLVEKEEDKWGAFRAATLALASSGTVTLELTATKTPMVVAYKLDRIASLLKSIVRVHSVVLPNLINGGNEVPEYIDKSCTAAALYSALIELYENEEKRIKQRTYLHEAAIKVGSTDQYLTADRAARVIASRIRQPTPPN